MGLLEEQLKGKSLADYTNEQLRISLNTALYTNTADMWKRYLEQQGYSGSVADMMAKWWAANNVPPQFRNYINSGLYLFNPRQLFQDGSIGVLYDNNDLTTMFVDAAGTTPATVNGLVGLQLDKSQGLVQGVERFADQPSVLDNSAGAATVIHTASTRTAQVTGAGSSTTYPRIQVSMGLTAAKRYVVTGRIDGSRTNVSSVRLALAGTANNLAYDSSTGVFSGIQETGATPALEVLLNGTLTGTVTIATISVRELPGNHRYQTTTGSKPILRGTPTGGNILTNGTFDTADGWTIGTGWTISGGVASAAGVTSDGLRTSITGFVTGRHYLVEFDKTGTSGISVYIRASTVFTTSASGRITAYIVAGSGATRGVEFYLNGAGTIDNVVVRDVTADVVTAPYGLQYDGVDDFLQTASVNFSATDKMFVCAGVRKLSDAALGVLVENGTNGAGANGGFTLTAPSNAGLARFGFGTRGTATQAFLGSDPYIHGTTSNYVVSCSFDNSLLTSALAVKPRINGATFAAANDGLTGTSSGNYTNAVLYFGRRNGTVAPYNGLDYGFVIVGKTLTAAQISSTERYIAQRTGVTL